jgi:hypothetical protein
MLASASIGSPEGAANLYFYVILKRVQGHTY